MKRRIDSRVINKHHSGLLSEYIDRNSLTSLDDFVRVDIPDPEDRLLFSTWMRDANSITRNLMREMMDLGTRKGEEAYNSLLTHHRHLKVRTAQMWLLLINNYSDMRLVDENSHAMGWSRASFMFVLIGRLNLLQEWCAVTNAAPVGVRRKYRGAGLPFLKIDWDCDCNKAPSSFREASDRPMPDGHRLRGSHFKELLLSGCIMYPECPIGALTQFQLYHQMRLLADNAGHLSIEDAELRNFLDALFLRTSEIFCMQFTYGAPELDLGDAYRTSSIYRGIRDDPIRRRRLVIDGSCGGGNGPMVDIDPAEDATKHERLRRESGWQANQRFIGEMMGMFMGFKKIMYVFRMEWKHEDVVPLGETQDFAARLLSFYLHQRRNAPACRTENDEYPRTSAVRPPARIDKKRKHLTQALLTGGYGISMDETRTRFDNFSEVFVRTIDAVRDAIVDQALRDRISKGCREASTVYGSVERAAFVAGNENERDISRVEELTTPHIALTFAVNKWSEKPLAYFAERHHGSSVRMCMYAHVFNKLTLDNDKNSNWHEQDCLDERALRNGAYKQRIQKTNPMPFVLSVMGDVFVVHGQQVYMCRDPPSALALWCLISAAIHQSFYTAKTERIHMKYLDSLMNMVFASMNVALLTETTAEEYSANQRLLDLLTETE